MTTVGIRLEDKNVWERRVPLVPKDLQVLREENGLDFIVEPSPRRVFSDEEYRRAGAKMDSDLSEAGVILAVKEVPLEKLLADKAYLFFAHVIKGQSYNMPLLRRLLELRCTLVDYERITNDAGKRLVLFGKEAGQAGMIDSLHVFGHLLAAEGKATGLEAIRWAHQYNGLEEAKSHIREVGQNFKLAAGGNRQPFVFGFTGGGNVSRGAQEIFDLLPHDVQEADGLSAFCKRTDHTTDRLVKVLFHKHHLARPKESGKAFDEAEYRQFPQRFEGRLIDFLPHVTVLINGIFWTDQYPRFFTRQEAQNLWRQGHRRLRLIGDITCDIDGAIELTHKSTTPEQPTYVYHPEKDEWRDSLEGEGIVVLAVDNLPCELPRDASQNFSRSLRRFLPALAQADYRRPLEELGLPAEIRRAVITHRGELMPDYHYLQEYLR